MSIVMVKCPNCLGYEYSVFVSKIFDDELKDGKHLCCGLIITQEEKEIIYKDCKEIHEVSKKSTK